MPSLPGENLKQNNVEREDMRGVDENDCTDSTPHITAAMPSKDGIACISTD